MVVTVAIKGHLCAEESILVPRLCHGAHRTSGSAGGLLRSQGPATCFPEEPVNYGWYIFDSVCKPAMVVFN